MPKPIKAVHLLAHQLADYQQRWQAETETVRSLMSLLEDPQDHFLRERMAGHFTVADW